MLDQIIVVSMSSCIFLTANLTALALAVAEPPAGYYDAVDPGDPAALRRTLHQIIDDHVRVPYTSTATDTWDVLELADQDPDHPSRILDVYKNASYTKRGRGNRYYSREHAWPKSYGFPKNIRSNYPYTDCHALFLSDFAYNSLRNNKPFDTCNRSCSEKLTDSAAGLATSSHPGNSNWTSGAGAANGIWETWPGRRGDVARALFYMDVRYEGGQHSLTGAIEPDLILTDDRSLIVANSSANRPVAYMGMLSVLLQWHREDPVDDRERRRNDTVAAVQHNRNPFIDHPEWVACIFEGICASRGKASLKPASGQLPQSDKNPWINEFHYDNAGADQGEFVEIAGPSGLNLHGWELVGYDGNRGAAYRVLALSGTIPSQQGTYGVLAFALSGLQNGSPDGLALVAPNGTVVDFISYEGLFIAVDGPAMGLRSTDLGVSESATTPVGYSIQRSGDHCSSDPPNSSSSSLHSSSSALSRPWNLPAPSSPGRPNHKQSLSCR